MHGSRSFGVFIGVVLAVVSCLLPAPMCAQQSGVRTIKDFPDQLKNELPKAEKVPRRGNQVRTAADFERAEAEQTRLAAEAARNQPKDANLDSRPKETVDTTQYRFSIPGPDLVRVAAQAGAVFMPRGGKPIKGGGNAAFQMAVHPGAMTSLARGHVMNQLKPQEFWVIESSSNRFHMFVDAQGNPLPLRKGWSVEEVVLKGQNYKWIRRPARGAASPYFEVELTAFHHANTVVEIAGAHLIGPPGVKNWEEAFIAPKRQAALPVTGRASVTDGEARQEVRAPRGAGL